MTFHSRHRICIIGFVALLLASTCSARYRERKAFFKLYPEAVGTVLDNLPSNDGHCGLCHLDFDGGGQRNAYGLQIEVAMKEGLKIKEAIEAVADKDADNDGFTNLEEIADTVHFGNTPTFPGLNAANFASIEMVNPLEVQPYLTPAGATDTVAPSIVLHAPNGGETIRPGETYHVTWTAADDGTIASIDLALSSDGGSTGRLLAKGLADTGGYGLFIPNLPSPTSRIIVTAHDASGNAASDESDADFTVVAVNRGVVPTTLRDFRLPGTQPFDGAILDDPEEVCASCHGDYATDTEPWANWLGSMMGQAMRDPLFIASLAVSEQDAPASGDLCLRCHTPGGWQEGRALDTSGGLLTAKDRYGVHCDLCHRAVDPLYKSGLSPAEDEVVLKGLAAPVLSYGNGQFVTDPDPVRRGPYADAPSDHLSLASDFHRRSDICGTCHDASNPIFTPGAKPGEYVMQDMDTPQPAGDIHEMFPLDRTYSEWRASAYASTGVHAPGFAGAKADGMVGSCQDCHMPDVSGSGADGGRKRGDLALHSFAGANYFSPDIIPGWFPGETDEAVLQAGKTQTIAMLKKAATLELSESSQEGVSSVSVRVTNETGHKLPAGYPGGRRVWINLEAFDATGAKVYESGAYDPSTGVLRRDADAKIYRNEPGISSRLAGALELTAGPSFHFVLNDTIFFDNRIPPRGFANAAFAAVQSPPVGCTYEDGQYWDDTRYVLPTGTVRVAATLYYQSTSKEYIEFLRDAKTVNEVGQKLYEAWVAQGMAAPVVMATATLTLGVGEGSG